MRQDGRGSNSEASLSQPEAFGPVGGTLLVCSDWGALLALGKCQEGMVIILQCPGQSYPVMNCTTPDSSN